MASTADRRGTRVPWWPRPVPPLPLDLTAGDLIVIHHESHDGPCLLGDCDAQVAVETAPTVIVGTPDGRRVPVDWYDPADPAVRGVAYLDPTASVDLRGRAAA